MDATTPPVPMSWLAATAEFLGLIDWAAWLFVALVCAGVVFMVRMDRDTKLDFRLVQFISVDGQANSWALARVTGLLTTTWMVWYETLHGRLSEWLVLAYLGTVFAASVWNSSTAAKERVAKARAEQGVVEPPSGTVTSTQRVQP